MKTKKKKDTLASLRRHIEELRQLRKLDNEREDNLLQAYRDTSNRLGQEQEKNKQRVFEKHHDEISKILTSLANINEAVSKSILSINGHL